MKISRIFRLLPVLAFGIMCCLLSGCAKKCIVPRPTLKYVEEGLLYKPDAGIAGVTQIKLNVFDAATNAPISSVSFAPGGSSLIPDSVLAPPVLVVTEYLSASGEAVAKDEQIISGGCRTYIGAVDVIIIRPAELAELCATAPSCTTSNTSATHSFSWNIGSQSVEKILVGNAIFLAVWDASTSTVHVIPCDDLGTFSTQGQEKGVFTYTSRVNTDAFTVVFTQDPNSPNSNVVTITVNISSPTAGLPACIN